MLNAAAPRGGEDLCSRIEAIGRALVHWQALWQEQAFRSPRLAWEPQFPELAASLRALDTDAATRLHQDGQACDAILGRWLPLDAWRALEQVPPLPRHTLRPWPRGVGRDVPGRKWAQVEAFVSALPAASGLRVLEWCAGKAHLARALAVQWPGSEVTALERDDALVAEAGRLARRDGTAVQPVACDVTTPAALPWLRSSAHVVALHACGHLHTSLLRGAVEAGTPALSLAPCCYHLDGAAAHAALSGAGANAWPGLRAEDLRTAVQETVTAEAHARRRRRRVQEWQLGFDLLARELRGRDEYMPQPAVGAAVLAGSFTAYCRHIARHKQFELPSQCDFAAWEAAGRRRFAEVTALDLVRHRLRRLLELWLVLDRALYLTEHGYAVQLGAFCERTLSPRNLLLQARRR